ncbi:MAG TPA: hypothetical protein VEM41_00625 [Actinomycetota bacterium]|nr:hypothetical protein [Actinomycetota bacterium]
MSDDVVEAQVDAYNLCDLAAFAACSSPDVVIAGGLIDRVRILQ